MLPDDERQRVLALWARLKSSTARALRRFHTQHLFTQCARFQVNKATMASLRAYANHRASALEYRRFGDYAQARKEATLAGHQVRFFRSL